ncbi:hypothetical protein DFS33DRAFT_1273536 [Desarmillaria ectypa]|nr:hypothetical protein DFS33DRAFT_1273536 [Desarmillaria ectypa]
MPDFSARRGVSTFSIPFDDIICEGMIGCKVFEDGQCDNGPCNCRRKASDAIFYMSMGSAAALNLGQQSLSFLESFPAYWDLYLTPFCARNSFHAWTSDFYGHNRELMLPNIIRSRSQLTSISNQTLEVLKNEEMIAINQDPVVGTELVSFRRGYNVVLERAESKWDYFYDDTVTATTL